MKKQKVSQATESSKNESGLPPPPSFPQKRESGNRDSESGKSMVEMLGVLALMGLLAVLGAKGYDIAMEHVMANDIIRALDKRAIVYSQQILNGNTSLSSDEFSENAIGGSLISANPLGSQFFSITVTNVSSTVCHRILDLGYDRPIQIMANNTVVTQNNQNGCGNTITGMTFTFTKDLRSCPNCLSGIKKCNNSSECGPGYVCDRGICLCYSNVVCNGTCCAEGMTKCNGGQCSRGCEGDDDCPEGYICTSAGMCVQCESYKDCESDEFCNLAVTGECAFTGYGVCEKRRYHTFGRPQDTYTASASGMTWYAADDFCKSINKSLLSLSDLKCSADDLVAKKCLTEEIDSIWDQFHNQTPRFWLKDQHSNKCSAFGVVYKGEGWATGTGGYYFGYYASAMCQ